MSEEKQNLSVDYQQIALESIPRVYNRDEHCVSRQFIDEDALKILRRLIRYGYKAYLVGGGVRDLLLEKPPKDFDIATDATPRKIKTLFRNCRIIGRRFKLAHIYFRNNKIIEVSTFRDFHDPIDIPEESDGESQMVQRDNRYGTEVTDAWRRDITINALFYDLSNFSIIDYVGGMQDLQNGLIRVIGDPDIRFAEDPVRLLRVVRHAARAGFSIESACSDSILKNYKLILQCSPVRLFEEFKKDLSSGYLLNIFQLSYQHQLLQLMLPELANNQQDIFSTASHFARTLRSLDQLFKEGQTPSVTACLSVIALHLLHPMQSGKELALSFMAKDELTDYLSKCFAGLAVPKKERERIEDSIDLWCTLENSPLERLSLTNLERRRHLDDVYWIMRIFKLDSGPIFDLVSEARQSKLNPSHQRSGRGKARNQGDQHKGPSRKRRRH